MLKRLIAFMKRLLAPKKTDNPVCPIPSYQLDWNDEHDWPDTEARVFER